MVQAHTQNWSAESRLGKIGRQHRTSRKLGGSITPRKIGRQELITNTRKNSCIIQKIGRQHYAHRNVCVCKVFVRVCAYAGVLGAHKNQHRKVQAHTQHWAAASRLGKNGRQHRTSRKLGGSITPRKIGRQELITNTRKNSCITQKIGRQHYAHRKVCVCVRVWASVCARGRIGHTQKPTQKGSGAHTKFGRRITGREN